MVRRWYTHARTGGRGRTYASCMTEIRDQTAEIRVVRDGDRGWADLVNPPGTAGTGGAEAETFTSPDGPFLQGSGRGEPATGPFGRPSDKARLFRPAGAGTGAQGRV